MTLFDEASPICRGKNLSWETVLLFFNNMPRVAMPKAQFNSYVESRINAWTQTHSQIARQLAFYYEENGMCYPRFTKETDLKDLFAYMQNWATKYFIPNPYAPSLKGNTPTCIYSFVIKSIKEGKTNLDEILDSIFQIKLSSHDKVNVYLSNFTGLKINNNHQVSINEKVCFIESELHPSEDYAIDVKKYFTYFSIPRLEPSDKKNCTIEKPLQQIFYGAPGTGKSNTIKKLVDEQKKRCHRTTFHPDSDYSTFVGAYKPTMKESRITKDGVTTKEEKIIYTFCPQAFTNAYVEAWKTEEEVYLVIEEINRGNCAQIFGDLFQLLDRKNGVSEYPVEADADLQSYLQKALADTTRTDIPEDVKSGKKLILPSNLFIWATMNTSDQSLFPIDSAFKRRWEWKYIKIKNHPEENYQIKIGEEQQDCWEFIKKINEIIASMTSSADKQLGYFFCCAKDGVIDEETFVSKVIFYLWNDVFKDYGFEDASLFRYIDNEGTERDLTFPDFYDEDGEKVNTKRLADFVKKVMSWKRTNAE